MHMLVWIVYTSAKIHTMGSLPIHSHVRGVGVGGSRGTIVKTTLCKNLDLLCLISENKIDFITRPCSTHRLVLTRLSVSLVAGVVENKNLDVSRALELCVSFLFVCLFFVFVCSVYYNYSINVSTHLPWSFLYNTFAPAHDTQQLHQQELRGRCLTHCA